ncbi:receptor-like protein 12 [Prunus avium]|uniref:Receptor-like protein 12 n=1 Tax=Prunus avium TaxID=42229 RepID=A0A6P5S4S9_PRUAV|nr:receptor-like protein 12 [Prunus avium]
MGSSWGNLFSPHCIVLLLLNVTHCFSFVQTVERSGHVDECSALFQFKESFTVNKSASVHLFAFPKVASWKREGDQNRSNCCSWKGVECDEESGHVVGLDLSSSCLYGSLNSNSSLFQLVHLQRLDLSDNDFHFSEIPSRLGHDLTNLTYLNLSLSGFSGQLPTSLGYLLSLNFLDISNCKFHPHVPSSLGNLTQLRYLDMSSFYEVSNNFSTGQGIDSWSWVGKLTKLHTLLLTETNITGKFLCFMANLTKLEHLNLATNEISGQIPSWFMKLAKLSTLLLGQNNLQGEIPRSLFQLKNLESLGLAYNNLSGLVEFDQFFQLKKLKVLRLSYNKLSLHIKTNLSFTLPQLQVLRLGSCNLTELPEFLRSQYELTDLYLGQNNIHGRIPKWLWNATRETLFTLDLSDNFLTGFEQNPIILPWKNLITLNLWSNLIQGSLPIPPQSIRNYIVPENHYSGEIPPSFCNLNHLHILDLSNNNLSGMLPQCLGNSSGLEIFTLNSNSFHGNIPQLCPTGESSLKMVDLSYNQLQGKVPRSIANCTLLEFFNLGNNQISDIFPSWLGTLPALSILILRSNGFHGMIGKSATNHDFPKLCIIDLSNNDFSGMLPSNYLENWNSMKFVDKSSEQAYFVVSSTSDSSGGYAFLYSITTFEKGVELDYFQTPYLLRLIDFSSNRFEGEIPAGIIGNLRALISLNLSNNALTGHIPSSLGNLTDLESLDLSRNQLSGRIPSNLAKLNFLEYFNVSHNYLRGPIPGGQQFETFLEDSYQGNSGLCGKALSKKCESSISLPPSIFEEDEDSGFQIELDWYVVLPGAISGLIVGVVAGNFWTSKNHEWFVETISRSKKPRGTRARRGHRN